MVCARQAPRLSLQVHGLVDHQICGPAQQHSRLLGLADMGCLHAQVDGDRPCPVPAPAGVKREASEAFSEGGQPEPSPANSQAPASSAITGPADEEGLAEFSRMLSVFTHCGRLKVVAQLLRPTNQHSSSILSSIEFDRDGEVCFT